MTRTTREPERRWSAPDAARRYAGERWTSARRRGRDPLRIHRLLSRHLRADEPGAILDAPCGTGRLRAMLERHGRYVGLDVSPAMLSEAGSGALVRGDSARLPFRDRSFRAVVCCRLLHHLGESALDRTVAELVRVSDGWVAGTFWDAGSLPAWRRRVLPGRRPPGRIAHPRARIEAAFRAAGAEVVEWGHSLRFVSRQAYFIARRRS